MRLLHALWAGTCCAFIMSAVAVIGCGARPVPEQRPITARAVPQVSGTVTVEGLSAPVRIVRDRWGIPHITARSQDDLFVAQGFVQAQDRLFQMDLWRRAVQGRLSEVLGANFIERDAMTRRMQRRGNLDLEWAGYGGDARSIASAFVRGVNAWIAIARTDLPEEFVLAGWAPDLWQADDLLNRTEAFVNSHGADDELFRARLTNVLGAPAAATLLGLTTASLAAPGVDLSVINYFVADMLRRVGTAPFFSGLAAPVVGPLRPDLLPSAVPNPLPLPVRIRIGGAGSAWSSGPTKTNSHPILSGASYEPIQNPSLRYLVHLKAPGWDAIGATAPWRPGVALGHNARIAWSFAAAAADTQDVYVERINPKNPRQVATPSGWRDMSIVSESVLVKGRKVAYAYERQYTPHGVVIAVDQERQLAYTVRWSGIEPGAAPELGALAVARANSWTEFRRALTRWKMPAADFAYADVDGHIGSQRAGLIPVRSAGRGVSVSAGWTGQGDWRRWQSLDQLEHQFDPSAGSVVAAPSSGARRQRLDQLLSAGAAGLTDTIRIQHDVVSWNARQLTPLLGTLSVTDPEVDSARTRLLQWNGEVAADSRDALLYIAWENALLRRLAAARVPASLVAEFVAREADTLIAALIAPSNVWFDGDQERVRAARDALLIEALAQAADDARRWSGTETPNAVWGRFNLTTFMHPLAVSMQARRRFNVGPFVLPGYVDTVFSTEHPTVERTLGPAFQFAVDLEDWDRSQAIIAPGQSEKPDSAHVADLAPLWARGDYVPLAFTNDAVAAAAESTLTLVPR
jgi:penicillin amidase